MDFIFYVFFILVLCSYIEVTATTSVVRFFDLFPLVVSAISFFVECWGIFAVYVKERKDYKLAELNFPEYRRVILRRIQEDFEIRRVYSNDLKKSYGKQKQRYPFNPFMGGIPNGKIRP